MEQEVFCNTMSCNNILLVSVTNIVPPKRVLVFPLKVVVRLNTMSIRLSVPSNALSITTAISSIHISCGVSPAGNVKVSSTGSIST